jgi:hypothetical protein
MRLHGGRARKQLRRGLHRRESEEVLTGAVRGEVWRGRGGSVREGRRRARASAQRLRRGLRRRGREDVEPFAEGRGSEKALSGACGRDKDNASVQPGWGGCLGPEAPGRVGLAWVHSLY